MAYHHGTLRAALIQAALDLLDENGPDRLSVREAARRAGVSPGAPFRHFADRGALMNAVAAVVLDDFRQHQRRTLAEIADRPAMWAFGLGFVRYATRHPHRFELVRGTIYSGAPPEELRPHVDAVEELASAVIATGQDAGELRPGDPAIVHLAGHALVYGLSQMIVDGFVPAERAEALAARVLDTFGMGVAAFKGD